jgi:hypothetical protein
VNFVVGMGLGFLALWALDVIWASWFVDAAELAVLRVVRDVESWVRWWSLSPAGRRALVAALRRDGERGG